MQFHSFNKGLKKGKFRFALLCRKNDAWKEIFVSNDNTTIKTYFPIEKWWCAFDTYRKLGQLVSVGCLWQCSEEQLLSQL